MPALCSVTFLNIVLSANSILILEAKYKEVVMKTQNIVKTGTRGLDEVIMLQKFSSFTA